MNPPPGDSKGLLGRSIRQARTERSISLDKLAGGTGLSTGFLSQLENGKVNISVGNLKKIADFLEVKMVNFFEEPLPDQLGIVTRSGQGVILGEDSSSAQSESLIREGSAGIQATLYRNPPGQGRKLPNFHRGEEFVFVILGEVIYQLNDQEYHLKTGDSMYFRSEAMHSWVNPGAEESLILVFNTPANW